MYLKCKNSFKVEFYQKYEIQASITLSKAIESLCKHCITPRTHAYQTRNVITNTRRSNRKKPHNTNTNNIVQI